METPSQEWLVSLFLEGLGSKELHSMVYMKHLKNLDQCIHEAIEYNDNCAKGSFGIGSQTNESTGGVLSKVDEIIQGENGAIVWATKSSKKTSGVAIHMWHLWQKPPNKSMRT